MQLDSKELFRRLGAGETIEAVCAAAGISRVVFDDWWQSEAKARVPDPGGMRRVGVHRSVQIERDRWGIPSIYADNDDDLFLGFGYAVAQDRLWQLDYLRRRGSGRLAEILGPGGDVDLIVRMVGVRDVLELDLLHRTVGLRRLAEREWETLGEEPRRLVTAFTAGVNALIGESQRRLPVEFGLLGYEPEPWSPVDCLTIEGEFRWYLTGRFPVIVMPELARRTLGAGPLYRAFLHAELDEESIVPPESYLPRRGDLQSVGEEAGDSQAGEGSNNWVIAGQRSATGKPLVASDPHVPFDAVSWWYEVHLSGGSFHVAGMSYTGIPAVMFGRNRHVAWGCTNNICSQRDLYQEKTDPAHPDCYLYDGKWESAKVREEVIHVKGSTQVRKTVRSSRNGPLVDEILPPAARQTGPVSLKWLGAHGGGWLTALLGMNRAESAAAFREATRPWTVPTFCVVYADVGGHVGFQATGRIPHRQISERGYRPGWDPKHAWDGLIPFEGMPHLTDPERGWAITANNRLAPPDYPYPLSGTWSDGNRFFRIRQMVEGKDILSRDDCVAMHQEATSVRATRCLPGLLKTLEPSPDARHHSAATHLRAWDRRMEVDRVGASIFDVFFAHWTKAVVRERFDGEAAGLLAGGAAGLASVLLTEDNAGWFAAGQREVAVRNSMTAALDLLQSRLGPRMEEWAWGRLHTLPLRHVLSGRGDLGVLLNHGGLAVKGDMTTVCNTGLGGQYEVRSGAGYRLIADLAADPPGLWAADAQSQSGHPGSPHYGDQLEAWAAGLYHYLALDRTIAGKAAVSKLLLQPRHA